jgi:hypothetical protein
MGSPILNIIMRGISPYNRDPVFDYVSGMKSREGTWLRGLSGDPSGVPDRRPNKPEHMAQSLGAR